MEDKIKILLTGGSGFIGKNLVEYLSKKYDLLAPSHSELDLTDKGGVDEYFKKNKIDVVVHAAAIGVKRNAKNIENSVKDNLKMFFNIIENKDRVQKIIFIGSGAEYDNTRDLINIKESEFGKIIPGGDYGFYKYVCSKYIENSDKIINLRIFGLFGKHEDYNLRFISNIICRELYNLPIEINQNRVMDYMYIEDFFKIIENFIRNEPKRKFYNVGGEKCDLLSLAEKIKKISGSDFEIILKKEGLSKEYTGNNTNLLSELKDFKFTDIDTALKELYDWYSLNKSKINKEELLKS
ncbi:MAG: NAD-dependent epimerase/dehydratase family protein [Nanoarchaeota archaeon]|nr:NAD-dependent epimerase/dehydratase family protein [Nanoarchaeota archaeon]